MEPCIFEHCEFAWRGQCCLVCPKGLNGKISRKNAANKIDECVKMLRRVLKKLPKDDRDLPRGVCRVDETYHAYIFKDKKTVALGVYDFAEDAILVRKQAEYSIKNGDFDSFLRQIREEQRERKRAKRRERKRGCAS